MLPCYVPILPGKASFTPIICCVFWRGALPSFDKSQILSSPMPPSSVRSSAPRRPYIDHPHPLVCGDVHGQFYDLIKLFEVAGGEPPANKFLFLGDYVDRGYFSLECYIYLLALKINYPQSVYLLRGNHECRHLTKHFTFKLECGYKYGTAAYDACMESFDALPLAAVVNQQFFCVHGGLSPKLTVPKDVNEIERFQETPKSGLMCDLLWTDPTENFGVEQEGTGLFIENNARGCSFRYSYAAVCQFLQHNDLLAVIRGHEAQDAGYRLYRNADKSDFPALITLFSAPNYVDVYNNKAAIMKYDGQLMNIRQFNCAPHPYYLPKFMSVFDWSLPFVGEKIAELLMGVLNVPNLGMRLETLSAEQRAKLEADRTAKLNLIRGKIRAIARVNKMLSTVRDERETLTELMNVMGTKIVPANYLTLGHEDLRRAIQSFDQARACDQLNEMLPDPDEASDASSVISLALTEPGSSGSPAGPDGKLDRHDLVATPPPAQQVSDRKSPKAGVTE